jgi:hypothetical protein
MFLLAAANSSRAAPIAFAFNGTVTEIDKSYNASFDLPFSVAAGDPMSGTLTLEPVTFGEKAVAPSLEFSLGGSTFGATAVPLSTYNNVFIGFGSHTEGPLDEISFGCSDAPTGCSMLSASELGVPLTDMGIGLKAGDVANNGDAIAISDFLNRFDQRNAVLVFGSFFNGGSITVYAIFGPMQAVAEPITCTLGSIAFSMYVVFAARRVRKD